jgi:hypothetical protein
LNFSVPDKELLKNGTKRDVTGCVQLLAHLLKYGVLCLQHLNINQQPKMALIKTTALQNVFCLDAPGMPTLELEKYPSEDPSRFINCK